ncbi:cysteine desulfurase [bacterium]|nr:cysteine desulfurase [bacterium]
MFNASAIKKDFPQLSVKMRGKDLVFLDNGASTQKPAFVIESERSFYEKSYANVHRGVYELSEKATLMYEGARKVAAQFINAKSEREIIFTRGTTESINLVASTFPFQKDDEILITAIEHHSNIVPWQMVCEKTGAKLVVAPMNDAGEIPLDSFKAKLSPRTKLVSIVHVSNVLGTINPVVEMTKLSHAAGAKVLIDGAQAIPHFEIDVQALGCDFYAFSGHKMYGPTGIGILWGREEILKELPPYQGGGDMIKTVSFEKTVYNDPPYRFEAGTPHIAGAIGLAAAMDYLKKLDRKAIVKHEEELLQYATQTLEKIKEVKIYGTASHKASVISFVIQGVHPHDIGTILDMEGIAIRAGHHCAQPVMDYYKIPATARASFALYNTQEDVDSLIAGIKKVIKMFA